MDEQTREILRALAGADIEPLITEHGLPAVRRYVAQFQAEGWIVGDLSVAFAGNVRSSIRLTERGQAVLDA